MERRASRPVIEGRRRGRFLAERLGVALRDERTAAGLTQRELARRALLGQTRISALERGLGSRTSIETWSVLAAALGRQLAAFWERTPGSSQPRDAEHLRRQELVVREATAGGWRAVPEDAVDLGHDQRRFVDVVLVRAPSREACVVEIWDLITDVGEAMRGLGVKVDALRRRQEGSREDWVVAGLWVLRGTQRNRGLVAEHQAVFASKFPGSSAAWLEGLRHPGSAMPRSPGLVWTDVKGSRLYPTRLARRPSVAGDAI